MRVWYGNGEEDTFTSLKTLVETIDIIEHSALRPHPKWMDFPSSVELTFKPKLPVKVDMEDDWDARITWHVVTIGDTTKKTEMVAANCHQWHEGFDGDFTLFIQNAPIMTQVKVRPEGVYIEIHYLIRRVSGYTRIYAEISACLQRAIEELAEPCPKA